MKSKEKLSFLVVLVMGSILFLIGVFGDSALAQKPVEWRVVVGWTTENASVRKNFIPFVEKVNKRAEGRLKISWVGPEAVPPFEQLKPVREGLFDACFTNPAYHMGEIPVAPGMFFFAAPAKEIRKAGLINMMDELYKKKANVTHVIAVTTGVGFHLMLKKRIDKADLTGLKIRTSPFYDPLIKGLNGSPVRIGGGEIYSALEKGVVDGATWPAVGALDYKWYEVAKYHVRPTFGEDINQLLVNLNSWNRLPKDLQDLLTKTAIEIEEEGRVAMTAMLDSEEKELQKRGVEILVLPPKEAEKYLNTFNGRGWEELVIKHDPELGHRLKEAMDRMRKR